MRDSSEVWCDAGQISLNYINYLAARRVEDSKEVDTVFLSLDIYKELSMQMFPTHTGTVPGTLNIIQLMTIVGPVTVKPVPHFTNFCYVGTASEYNQLEWIRIGEAFEKEILGE